MGAIGGLLGVGGGQSGTGIAPAQQANVVSPTTNGQAQGAYGQNQAALQSQQNLMNVLNSQNGIGNQSQVYGQLQGVANGTGPNPAQAMLNQSTGQNVASQAALMAGQRGASQNVGLLARQAAMQGANTQQQAVGQGATLQANQQLNAINAAGNIANTQAANQIAATGANTSAQQAEQGNLLNAIQGQNSSNVSSQSSVNAANAGLANTQLQGQQGLIGGVMNAAGSATNLFNHGGAVNMAQGGTAGPQSSFGQFLATVSAGSGSPVTTPQFSGNNPGAAAIAAMGKSKKEKDTSDGSYAPGDTGTSDGYDQMQQSGQLGMGPTVPGSSSGVGSYVSSVSGAAGPAFKGGGMVDIVVSPGEKIVSPEAAKKAAAGGKLEAKTVPGKAMVSGDSVKNDTVPLKARPGTVIVKRTRANNDPKGFVRDAIAKRGKK